MYVVKVGSRYVKCGTDRHKLVVRKEEATQFHLEYVANMLAAKMEGEWHYKDVYLEEIS